MRRLLPVVAFLPGGLFAQAITELSPLEYRNLRQEALQASASRKLLSFEQSIPAPSPYRLGTLRQVEIDAVEQDPHLPLRGVERMVERRSGLRGEWVTLDDGRTAWRLAIQSDGASGVRLEFSRFSVGSGEVWLYSEDHSQVFGPYTGAGPDGSGQFWSNTVFADNVVVEYLPDQPRTDTPFQVSKLLHVLAAEQAMAAGSCELDVSCYPDWSAVASGVGLYFFQKGGGGYACTGALVNNTNKDGKPYFLTANHCVADAATARTVDVFWNYQASSCNGKAPSLSGLPQTLGATWLASASMANGDYSLIQLSPLPNINLTFYGWNGSATALQVGDPATGVHHPQVDFKRIAFGIRDPDMNAQVGSEYAPAALYYQVRETAGRIEPGSSGSPLFTAAKVVVGTLTYGPPGDACSISPFSAGYGRFSAALPALSPYLSPAPGSVGGGTPLPAAPVSLAPSSLRTTWTMGSPPPVAQNVQITTASSSTVSLSIKANQAWILPSATAMNLTQTKPATLAISVNVQALTAAGAYLGSVSVTGTGINQSIPVEVDV
ncbi:MAG TPA: trypsin-like peptidase domain-containing protein, partial [Bryobacteraceae bacterium]|nr:trypsin-like peptidase domain-containing protein [Bryobacteraceae bacterium]